MRSVGLQITLLSVIPKLNDFFLQMKMKIIKIMQINCQTDPRFYILLTGLFSAVY